MTCFIDKTGYTLAINMTDKAARIDFEDEFFSVGGLKMDDRGRYIVDSVDYLMEQAKDCWACTGDFADGGEGNTFDLYCNIRDETGDIYKMFDSEYIADMADTYDVPYSACI